MDNIENSGTNTTLVQALSSVWDYHYEENQLYPELANVMSLSPFDGTVSASRKQMFGASHTSQCLVIAKPTPRRIQTGAEIQYGRATFSTTVERDCRIIARIPFYNPRQIGVDAIQHNPEDVLIVEYLDNDRSEIDCISMREYFSSHQYFGFRYKNSEASRNLRVPDPRTGMGGSELGAGTILQDSPSKRPDGNYCYGINLNVMFASIPQTAEDGVVLSDEAVPWLKTRKYEKRTIAYGSTHWALNLYGDENTYKPFPEIGDYVRADGLLMALRSYSDAYSAVEMSAAASREINYVFDKLTYVHASPEEGMMTGRGRVIDIRVTHDASRTPFSPNECNEQALKYDRAARVFYEEVLRWYYQLRANRPKTGANAMKITDNFKTLVRHAYSVSQEKNPSEDQRVQKIHRASPMDDFTIEFIVEYEATPTEGYKLTDCWGGKGVVVEIRKKEDMPVDEQGNRAYILMDGGATVSRQNLGRLYEQGYNAASRDLTKEFCNLFGTEYPDIHGHKLNMADRLRVTEAYKSNNQAAWAAWNRFRRFISVVSPKQDLFYGHVESQGPEKVAEHMISILEDGIYIYHPSNNDPELPDVVDIIEQEFMPHISPVTYRDDSGEFVTSIEPILIAQIYFILLEKTGDDWTAVSSGKLQNFGILSHINNQDKYSAPWRQQSIRAWGETETAIGVSYMGWEAMAELIDRNNNIAAHRMGVYSILRSRNPTNIPVLVDRAKIPYGNAKPLELVKHLAVCNGWQFTHSAYQEMEPKPTAIQFVQ